MRRLLEVNLAFYNKIMRRIGPVWLACCLGASFLPALAQVGSSPLILSRPIFFTAPAIESAGKRIGFGSAVAPDGSVANIVDAYLASSDGSGSRRLTNGAGTTSVSLSPDGLRLAYTMVVQSNTGSSEQVHVVDTTTGEDRAVVIDREGCIVPLVACA